MSLNTTSKRSLNTSRVGDSPTSLGSPLQCLRNHSSPIPSLPSSSIPFYSSSIHSIPLHFIPFHSLSFNVSTPLTSTHTITPHCIALHRAALHCIALHCVALHCTALHCIAFLSPPLYLMGGKRQREPCGAELCLETCDTAQPHCSLLPASCLRDTLSCFLYHSPGSSHPSSSAVTPRSSICHRTVNSWSPNILLIVLSGSPHVFPIVPS